MRSGRHDANGSILIEQLLAIAILGLAVVSTFSLLTTGTLAAQTAQKFSLAGVLAAQKLEEVATGCDGPTEMARGRLDGKRFSGYEWQAEVQEVAPGLCRVTVTLWWRVRGLERSLNLVTLVRRQEEP